MLNEIKFLDLATKKLACNNLKDYNENSAFFLLILSAEFNYRIFLNGNSAMHGKVCYQIQQTLRKNF